MKIGLLITARLKSTRLPQKLLLDLNGRTVIERVIDRAKKVYGIDQIAVCTSTDPQDKPLTDIAIRNDIHYYLGDPKDVLGRLNDAADFFGLDYVISITGENPLFSIYHANILVDHIKQKGGDFMYFDGLPVGCGTYGINKLAMEVVCNIKDIVDTEIWGPLLKRPEIFDVDELNVDPFYNRPDLRITTDYLEDYQFINTLFEGFEQNITPSLLQILNILDNNPNYYEINNDRQQAQIDESILKKIDRSFSEDRKKILDIKKKIYKEDRL